MQVLTGVAFAANNVQRKVLFVNICLRTSTWTFPANTALTTDVRFPLASRVTFVALDQEPEGRKKRAPPLVVPLPEVRALTSCPAAAHQQSLRIASCVPW